MLHAGSQRCSEQRLGAGGQEYVLLVDVRSSCLQKGSVLHIRKQEALECLHRVGRIENAIYGGENEMEFKWKSLPWLAIEFISLTKSLENEVEYLSEFEETKCRRLTSATHPHCTSHRRLIRLHYESHMNCSKNLLVIPSTPLPDATSCSPSTGTISFTLFSLPRTSFLRSLTGSRLHRVAERGQGYISEATLLVSTRLIGIYKVVKVALDYVNWRIHLSLDVDTLDPSFAPNAGAPVRGGLTGHYILEVIHKTGFLVALNLMTQIACGGGDTVIWGAQSRAQ
ncbi:uncharacterized protein BJ212DRAFT_1303504 [Suillus subaureus]|uniref:Uncharacterized protein n=1 Tax=Suillus subaureus TaxID=48587 RepID=A0A9P7J826_9AGAM|nr:uncharacterized protein BJ212DRAFT_1303504 [Suillus subaureus]KAG1807280.1 hypothetical protein BJ212DRAFT_1303504 [Suillus subaureus]